MKHLPAVDGKGTFCGAQFPNIVQSIEECDCPGCLWRVVGVCKQQEHAALKVLRGMDSK
jgi:hypothetical protein